MSLLNSPVVLQLFGYSSNNQAINSKTIIGSFRCENNID